VSSRVDLAGDGLGGNDYASGQLGEKLKSECALRDLS
jgi:hypothetical protein